MIACVCVSVCVCERERERRKEEGKERKEERIEQIKVLILSYSSFFLVCCVKASLIRKEDV